MSEPTLEEVLARREARRDRQRAVVEERHMPVVVLTMVQPGPVKSSDEIRARFREAADEVITRIREWEHWPIWVLEEVDEPTGPELILAVDADTGDLKRAMVALEEGHPHGRLWDVDVVDEGPGGELRVVTRDLIGAEPRRCLVCDEPSAVCARSRRHPLEELDAAIAALSS